MTNYDELSALDKAATPGPWEVEKVDFDILKNFGTDSIKPFMQIATAGGLLYLMEERGLSEEDAIREIDANLELIIAMRNGLPEMLEEIEVLQKERNDLLERLGKIKETLEEFPHEISPTTWEYLYELSRHPDASGSSADRGG